MNKLYRSNRDKEVAGVCGGLGEYFNIDPMLFRAVFIGLLLCGGIGAAIYLGFLIVIPISPMN